MLVRGGENLIENAGWEYARADIEVVNGKVILWPTDTSNGPVNEATRIKVNGDWGVAATVENSTDGGGGIMLIGAFQEYDWWQGLKRIEVMARPGRVNVVMRTGTSKDLFLSRSFPVRGLGNPAQIEVRKTGSQFVILANGSLAGRVDDPGLFEIGDLYLGAYSAAHNQLTIHSLSVLTRRGEERNVQSISRPTELSLLDAAPPLTLGNKRQVPRNAAIDPSRFSGPSISPMLWGTNYEAAEYWPDSVMDHARRLNLTVIRMGGTEEDRHRKSKSQVDRFVATARATGAEPLLQVRLYQSTPQEAAEMVRYLNVERKYGVRFWAIGNEPDIYSNTGFVPFTIDQYNKQWRAFYTAMKQVDPSILIMGPDTSAGTDPDYKWTTPFLQANGDVVDIVSMHYYPFYREQRPDVLLSGPELFGAWVRDTKALIQRTTGRNIPFAVPEFNTTSDWLRQDEASAASIYAGVYLADLLGTAAQSQVYMLNFFTFYERSSLSMIRPANGQLRPTYYAMEAYKDFGGSLLTTASNVNGVKAYASRSDDGRVNVVLTNRNPDAREFDLVFRVPAGSGQVGVGLNSPLKYRVQIDGYGFASLMFDGGLRFTGGTMFSKRLSDVSRPPEAVTITLQP